MRLGPRYAIYFAPGRDTPLDRFGSHWLGRRAWDGVTLQQPSVPNFPSELLAAVTESPRQYGFHSTLKPPFHLKEGFTVEALERDLEDFTANTRAFEAPRPVLQRLGRFLALVLPDECAAMRSVADNCVQRFDRYRSLPLPEETARRKRADLSPRQLEYLENWGYPYVFDDWQFHMSLTGSVDAGLLDRAQQALVPLVKSLLEALLEVNALCLFEQPGPSAPFVIRREFPLRNGGPS